MDGYEKQREKLEGLGVQVVAASVDTGDDAKKIADKVGFTVLEGVTREQADQIGAWWEDRRGIVQPSEFILDAAGTVKTSTYSSGPVGRIAAESAVGLIEFYESQR